MGLTQELFLEIQYESICSFNPGVDYLLYY